LITSPEGHVVIDGTVPEAASQLLANVRELGFDVRDIKYVLNSHAHFDHSGGIAEIQKASGAKVLSSPAGAAALSKGRGGADDPQFTSIGPFPAVAQVKVLPDRKSVAIGSTEITVQYTPGHTPGGTSWSWRSCEQDRCLDFVYADSLNAVSADDFSYSGDPRYPNAAADLRASMDRIESLACDVIISAHPEGSGLWEKIERRKNGEADAMIDPQGCREYARGARERLEARLAKERQERTSE
jgi:metallo-beta-lactamase class B